MSKDVQQGGGEVCETCDGAGHVVTYADPYDRGDVSSPEQSPCPACTAPPSAPVGGVVVRRAPTHYCRVCGALWADFGTHWSLVSASCGKCCDNVPMGEQIAPLALLTATAAEIRAVKRARDFLARSDASEAEGDAFAGGWSECEAYVAQQPAAVDEFVTIDGRRYAIDTVRAALLGLASDLAGKGDSNA